MLIGIDGTMFTKHKTGIANYGYELLCRLPQFMPNAKFVIFSPNPPPADWALDSEKFRWTTQCHFYERPMIAYKAFGMAMAAVREKIDIFWAVAGVAPAFMPCPVLLTVYDYVYLVEAQSMPLQRRIFRTLSQPYWTKRASRVNAISAAVAEETERYIGRKVDSIIMPSVDQSFYPRGNDEIKHVKSKYGIDREYYLIVGTLEPRKNLQLFLETYMEQIALAKKTPPVLVISGSFGWKTGPISELIAHGVQQGWLKAIGYADFSDLPALYSGAAVLFMPSRYEGFGMPILEARMCGCKVVCSDVAAMREAGGSAAFYHAPDKQGIRNALTQVFSLPSSDEREPIPSIDWSWESGARQLAGELQAMMR